MQEQRRTIQAYLRTALKRQTRWQRKLCIRQASPDFAPSDVSNESSTRNTAIRAVRNFSSFRCATHERNRENRNSAARRALSKDFSGRRVPNFNTTYTRSPGMSIMVRPSMLPDKRLTQVSPIVLQRPGLALKTRDSSFTTAFHNNIVNFNMDQLRLMENIEQKVRRAKQARFSGFCSPGALRSIRLSKAIRKKPIIPQQGESPVRVNQKKRASKLLFQQRVANNMFKRTMD
ncbi:unnamed protein product [Moneuplotes crassus]|uniref:Uncharacterized protein n=1 Tax=Euplotes crassus TaxID=5936 RepID=A0AAD1U1R5_EUPCR|nr:unnamed protein product [Moneuplotes crassus]